MPPHSQIVHGLGILPTGIGQDASIISSVRSTSPRKDLPMHNHLLMFLIASVTLVLLTILTRPETPFLHILAVIAVLVVLIMVIGGAARYLPSVLRALANLFNGR